MKRSGFTLIEMLVVIVVIGIMTAMVFKIFSMATRKGYEAQCIKMLECISHALNEFYVEYGQYPPASGMGYTYENTELQPPNFRNVYLPQNPDWKDNPLFNYGGLVAWLWPRDDEGINKDAWPMLPGFNISHRENEQYIGDTERDRLAKERWARFLEEVPLSGGQSAVDENVITDEVGDSFEWPYTNSTLTVRDPWGNSLHYVSKPPFQSYRLWSSGADEADGTDDDIHRDKWDL